MNKLVVDDNFAVKDDVLVTVGMVTYNSEFTLRNAIDSVLVSSWYNLELLIIDDNSCDSSWDIICSYDDNRIRRFKNEHNIGEYANRNQIVDNTRGEFLIFIDGDDMIYPHGLEFMTRMLLAFPNSGMALMRWYKKNVFYPIEISSRDFLRGVYFNYGFDDIAFANTFFRVSCLREIDAMPVEFPFGDSFVRLNLGLRYDVLLISDGLTWWRETPGQASSIHFSRVSSLVSFFKFKFDMLEKQTNLFSDIEKFNAVSNLNKDIVRASIKFLIKLEFKNCILLLRSFKISLIDIILYRFPHFHCDPFANNTSMNPVCEPLASNPFSRAVNTN